jgi:hypothetical protein
MSEAAEVTYAREEILNAAAALLAGEISALKAAQRIASLRYDLDPAQQDENLLTFAGIDSQTDHLTVFDSLEGWHPSVREEKERELAEAEAFFRAGALESAKGLIGTYRRSA